MSDATEKRSLPRRDWILLPLLSVLTVLVMLLVAEGVARLAWPEQEIDACLMQGSDKPKPDCVAMIKAVEGPWVETRYNECGYRATGPCRHLPPPGTERVAVLGSSTSFGHLVDFDDVWSVQAAREVADRCGHPVDVQSLIEVNLTRNHLGFGSLNDMARRLPEAMALHPTLVTLLITPFDLADMPKGGFNPLPIPQASQSEPELRQPGLMERLRYFVTNSRAVTVAQHFIYRDAKTYVWTYLHYGDRADFLRTPLSPLWQERLTYLDATVGYIADQMKPTGTPLFVVLAPTQAQAYIIADNLSIPGVDAEAFGRAVGEIAQRHGASYVDGAAAFEGVKDAPNDFYQVDGHFDAAGHEVLARVVAKAWLTAQPAGYCAREAAR